MNIGVAEATFMTRYFNLIVTWNWDRLGIFVGGEGNHFVMGLPTKGDHLMNLETQKSIIFVKM